MLRRAKRNSRRALPAPCTTEALEDRALLTNLALTGASLVQGDDATPLSNAILGEQVNVRVDYVTDDQALADYRVEFRVDGVVLDTVTNQGTGGGNSGSFFLATRGWYATPGTHTIEVILDADDDIAEDNETDNSTTFTVSTFAAAPPVQFAFPVEGEIQQDSFITDYIDIDPTAGVSDFAGGIYSTDGNDAWQIGVPHFEDQDAGVDVLAAAAGTVVAVNDGEFDRQTAIITPEPESNFVVIDHGNGYRSIYRNLRRDSVEVAVGDTVAQGERIGRVGSSGASDEPHLGFGVEHNGLPVEPILDVATYLQDTPDYSGDVVRIRSSRVTSYAPASDIEEGPGRTPVFSLDSGQDIFFYGQFTSLKQNDVLEYVVFRPSGLEWTRSAFTITQDEVTSERVANQILEDSPEIGQWRVDFLVNGEKIGEDGFEVRPGGAPEMLVADATGTIVVNNRYTPFDFGTTTEGGTEPELSFFVENVGSNDLRINDVSVPQGFRVSQTLPDTIAPGATSELIVSLDSTFAGYFGGEIVIDSNDSDDPVHRFSIEGQVELTAVDNLQIGIGVRSIDEGGNTVANISRTGSTATPLTVNLSSDDPTQVSFPPTVTIPAGQNFASFFITAVDDQTVEGDMTVQIVAETISLSSAVNTLEIIDDDFPDFVITETGGDTTVDESGTADTFDVALSSQPLTDVVFDLTVVDPSEVSVSINRLTFTNANWDVPQVVTVTGQDDMDLDGPVGSLIELEVTPGSDAAFLGLTGDVTVVTTDDDVAAFQISASGGATVVGESGTTDSFDFNLAARPLSDVVVAISSSDPTEAIASPGLITISPADWNTLQTVTVTGVDDFILDGNRFSNITLQVVDAQSFIGFQGVERDVPVTTLDDDVANIVLTPTDGFSNVSESGTTDQVGVSLAVEPLTDVVVSLTTTDAGEVGVGPAQLTFTPDNWDIPQAATVTGIADDLADGDQTVSLVATVVPMGSDPAFIGTAAVSDVTNRDEDAVIIVNPTSGITEVTEGGGSDTVAISLKAAPLGDVVVELTPTDLGEVSAQATNLTFTTLNWNQPQTATVTGVDDFVVDGTQNTTVVVRSVAGQSHAAFAGAVTQTFVSTVDDETAGIVVTPTGVDTRVRENGTTDSVDISLAAQPLSTVVVQVASGDLTEVLTPALRYTFTPANWNTPQQVNVIGVDDVTLDGDQTTSMSITVIDNLSQNLFDGLVQPFDVITEDNEAPTWTIEESDGTNVVSEDGNTDTFDIVLDAQPTSDVTVELVTNSPDEISTDLATLTFTSTNWNVTRTVTILGVDDAVVDGQQSVSLTLRTIDALTNDAFDALEQTLTVVNEDDDIAGIVLTESGGTSSVTEGATDDTIGVTLNAKPLDDVVLEVDVSDGTQLTAAPTVLTFTPANWDIPQDVTVAAVDDVIADGDEPVQVAFSVLDASSHVQFHGLTALATVTVVDNDASISVLQTNGGTVVDESGTSDTIDIVLDAQPLGDVVVSSVSRDGGEVTASPTFLTFTASNWSTPQTVTLTGVDDVLLDGTQSTQIDIAVVDVVSADAYDGIATLLSVATTDDDTPDIVVTESGGSTTVSELLTTDSFTVRLAARPLSPVVIDVTSFDTTEATVSPATLTFDPVLWNTPQTVTVFGVDDMPVDGNQVTPVVLRVDAAQSDAAFGGQEAGVDVTTVDNEVASFTVTQSGGTTAVSETGTTDDFSVVLDAAPTQDVVLAVSTTDPTEADVDLPTLTFTPANWDTPQVVTVIGVDDPTVDGTATSIVQVQVIDGLSDSAFAGLVDSSVQVTTTNDDVAGFSLAESNNSTVVSETGTSDTFQVILDRQPETGIVFFTSTNAPDELSVSPALLTFTSANWSVPQTVTVTGLDDSITDSNGPFDVFVAIEESRSDNAFDSLPVQAVQVSNISDEPPLVAVDDSVQATRDTSLVFDVLTNDAPSPEVRILSVGSADNGTVEQVRNGRLEYTPDPGFVGVDSFEYSIVRGTEKLNNLDAGIADEFGHAIAIDGDLAVIGVPKVDLEAPNAGIAYIYERRSDGGWSKIAEVTAPDADQGDAFGFSVAIDGSTLVVGSTMDDDEAFNSGAVYIFERNLGGANNYGLVTKLTDANGGSKDQFGYSLGIDNGTLLVGARLDDNEGRNSGSAFVYDQDAAGNWNLTTQLLPSTLMQGDQFGYDVAIDGDLFLVGARKSNEQRIDSGSAYLFDRNLGGANSFGIVRQFVADDAVNFDWFGQSVDINNGVVVVGKPIRNGRQRTGEVYVYERNEGGTDNWGLVTQTSAPDGGLANQYGFSVALNDTTLYAGTRLDQNVSQNAGRVYAHSAADDWDLSRVVDSYDSANGDYFGQTVAASNTALFVTSPRDDDNGNRSGSVFTEDLTRIETATVTVVVSAPLLAPSLGQRTDSQLTQAQLADAVDDAIAEWVAAGITQEQLTLLRSVNFSINDLAGTQLGGAFGTSIILDTNAAGNGWKIGADNFGYDPVQVAAHELGHVLGFDDLYDEADRGNIMFGILGLGEERDIASESPDFPELADLFFQNRKEADEVLFAF